ncbi:DUF397 domain-containing protein [Spirillospora albida]|uniref:DUF397 domain-containing protein n=1 Tax=Spirillospora albida TaxID=58123 RepID=UPI0004C105BE|nr:DUF397 domain-containing protein [Spirillospora albida]
MSIPDLTIARWRKSSHSTGQGGDCVEVAGIASTVAVRDSKDPDGPMLILGRAVFGALTRDIRASDHDL